MAIHANPMGGCCTPRSYAAIVVFLIAVLLQAGLFAQEILVPTNTPNMQTLPVNPGDTNVSASFRLNSTGDGFLEAIVPVDGATIRIVDPSGVEIGGSAIEYKSSSEFGLEGVPRGVFRLNSFMFMAGEYRLSVDFPTASERTAIMLTVANSAIAGEPSYEIAVVVPQPRVTVETETILGVLVMKNGTPVTGLQPELTITSETGISSSIALRDDGQGSDGQVNDGLYSSAVELVHRGTNFLSTSVQFVDEGRTIQLTANGRVEVLQQRARFVNAQTRLVLSEQAGQRCVSRLEQRFDIYSIEEDSYFIAAGLVAGDDVIIQRALDKYPPGLSEVVINFSSDELRRAAGANQTVEIETTAPQIFTVGDTVDVSDTGSPPVVVFPTPQTDRICRSAPILLGRASWEPIIENNFISSLAFSIPVDVEDGGSYDFSFEILGADQKSVIVEFSQSLDPDFNAVPFEVNASDLQTFDGPFHVISGSVDGPSHSVRKTGGLGYSDSYLRWQFSADREGDLDGDGDIDRDDVNLVLEYRNKSALSPGDRRDINGDGEINLLDARQVAKACDSGDCELPSL